jgi:hypothetical protein
LSDRVRGTLALVVGQGAVDAGHHSHSQSHLSRRRIGADNSNIVESFNAAAMGNTPDSQATGDIGCDNDDFERAFNKARMGNVDGPDIKHVQNTQNVTSTAHTTIAGDNRHLKDAFVEAIMGNTSAPQTSLSIATGNRDITGSFNGARFGNTRLD